MALLRFIPSCLPVLLFVAGIVPAALAQEHILNTQLYGIEAGLSHREVFDIHQDREGFIWIATKSGLNRFDGRTFKWWTQEKNGLANNEIHHILEDADGWLWLFTGINWFHAMRPTQVSLLNTHTGKVVSLEKRFGNQLPFKANEIERYRAGHNGSLIFSTRNHALYVFHPSSGFRKIPHALPQPFIPLFQASDHTLWCGVQPSETSMTQLIQMDEHGKVLKTIELSAGVASVEILGADSTGQLWYTEHTPEAYPALFRLNLEGIRQPVEYGRTIFKNLPQEWSQRLFYEQNQDLIWAKSKPYFFVFHPQNGVVFDFSKRFKDIIDAGVQTIFFDRDQAAWIGTSYGLYRVELKANAFTRYLYTAPYNADKAYSCRGILADETGLVVNTYKGRMVVTDDGKTSRMLPKFFFQTALGEQRPLMYFPLLVWADNDATRWFGETGLVKQDVKTGAEQVFYWQKKGGVPEIWSMYKDQSGKLWLGTTLGLAFLDGTRGIIQPVTPQNGFKELAQSFVHAFIKSRHGHVWLATTSGLYAWTPDRGILARWWLGGKGTFRIPHENVLHVHEDKTGDLWLATGGGGLIRLQQPSPDPPSTASRAPSPVSRPPSTVYQQFTIADGLSNNNLYAVYEDDRENLWMSSDNGIIRFDKKTLQAKAFLPADGITHQEFNRISHYKAADGTLYFGGLNGVTAFQPSRFYVGKEDFNAPLQITDFQQFDSEQNKLVNKTETLLQTRSIALQPSDRFFLLEFALLDYSDPDQVRYAWKVEGLAPDWTYINENFIRVSGLPAGHYTLKIRGQGADGRWSSQEIVLPLTILRPFYETPVFWGSVILLLLGSGFFFYKWRTRQFKNRQLALEHLVEERTETIQQQAAELRRLDQVKSRFFANVSHELRTPLTLMLGPIGSALKSRDLDPKTFTYLNMAQQNGQTLLKFINEILDLSKLESGKLELQEKTVALLPLLRRLLSQFESHARQQGIDLVFSFQPDPYLQVRLDAPKFEVILNNLLSNALKFTPPGGNVLVTLEDRPNTLVLKVADSGPGIHADDLLKVFDRFYQAPPRESDGDQSEARGGTGIGLALCREYAGLFGGKIIAESVLGQGATFVFEFPKKEVLGAGSDFVAEIPEAIKEQDKPLSMIDESYIDAKRPHLLLVEDNYSLRQYIQMVLGEQYQITTANNGQAALQWLDGIQQTVNGAREAGRLSSTVHRAPDLIISDVMMPVMDGFQFLEALKNEERWRSIPVIMLTARAELRDKLRALRIGVDDYMLKPFEEEELRARLENLLKNARERKEVAATTSPSSAPTTESAIPTVSAADMAWLEAQENLLRSELANENFTATEWAARIALSERHLQRRLKALTGLSPHQYFAEMRLAQARQLLEDGQYRTVSEVAYAVGFSNLQSFTRNFRQRFGRLPSGYF